MDFPFENALVIDLDFGGLCSSFSGSGSTYRNGGWMFHGSCHIRMNLALPLSRVQEAFRRMDRYVFNA